MSDQTKKPKKTDRDEGIAAHAESVITVDTLLPLRKEIATGLYATLLEANPQLAGTINPTLLKRSADYAIALVSAAGDSTADSDAMQARARAAAPLLAALMRVFTPLQLPPERGASAALRQLDALHGYVATGAVSATRIVPATHV